MSDHLSYDDLRADTVRQVATLMAAAAVTASTTATSAQTTPSG
jgi:hypothetical protein